MGNLTRVSSPTTRAFFCEHQREIRFRLPRRRSFGANRLPEDCRRAHVIAENGLIVVHDYFPDGRALWPDGVVIPVRFPAVEKVRSTGFAIKAVPLGTLRWLTKLNTNTTRLRSLQSELRCWHIAARDTEGPARSRCSPDIRPLGGSFTT